MADYGGCRICAYNSDRDAGRHCSKCIHNCTDQFKRATNADRIRNMTDDELVEFLNEYFHCEYYCPVEESNVVDDCCADCPGAILKWLQKECEDE